MKMVLIGIGQEVSLDQLNNTKNFLLFKKEDGTDFRVHVTQEAVQEVLMATADVPEHSKEMQARIALETLPDEEHATEFGGGALETPEGMADGSSDFIPEPPEQYGDEDSVPSL